MVRPADRAMAEAAAVSRHGDLPESVRQQIRAHASAADNVAVFFGEDTSLHRDPVDLADQGAFLSQKRHSRSSRCSCRVWAIPTAIAALLIHCTRLALLDRRLSRGLAAFGREGAR
ncbi:DUF969 domain-containing protein [Burkholderia multivorans]|uniref:5-oxoproline transporter, DUF969 family subunit n=1 Tax=Burkholderia multivorans TaxID=87883 RepID=UPI00201B18D8|nr:DUF969 family protein [Burkholderia multivorans]MCL4665200.1 DUF969 domain-containing protein [Burkholderia multivorans]